MRPTTAALAVLTIARVACAADPATTPASRPPADVAAMIRQLDADDPAARDAAVDQLVALGEPVDPAVADAAARSTSPEARSRAAGVIARLKRMAADRPTTITLHLHEAALGDVIAAINKQAGVTIKPWPGQTWAKHAAPVTVDLDAVPFWQAIDIICKQIGARPEEISNGTDLAIMLGRPGGPMLVGPTSTAAHVTAVAKKYTRFRTQTYADGEQSTLTRLELLLLLDPKVRLAPYIRSHVLITDATDDKGTSLVESDDFDSRYGRTAGLLMAVAVPLRPPAAGATRIATLKGELIGQVVVASEDLTIDDLAHAVHAVRTVGPYTVTVRAAAVTGRSVSYTLAVQSADGPLPDLSGIHVEDADGRPITGTGGSSDGRDGPRLTFEAETKVSHPIKEPVRLVWPVSTRTKPLRATFELHDLPLPTP